MNCSWAACSAVFQSTLSVRRATKNKIDTTSTNLISIHALRKESDCFVSKNNPNYAISIHALRKESDMNCT